MSAMESATAPLGVPVVGLPVVLLDHSHQPIIAATTMSSTINNHGAPRFFSSILISATLPSPLECVLRSVATNVPLIISVCKGFLHFTMWFLPSNNGQVADRP